MKKSLRILIVEDSLPESQLIESQLRGVDIPFAARTARNRDDFIVALKESPPDVILAEYKLAGFNGLQALAIAREQCPDVPFIAIAGQWTEEVVVEFLKRGASDFVSRDRLDRLAPVIKRALRDFGERTEKRRTELTLRDSESRFRAVFDGVGTGIAVEDLRGRVVESNRALQQMLGYTAEELRAITRRDFTHAPSDEELAQQERLLSGAADYYQMETQFVRKDGRILWGRLTVTMVRDSAGQPQFPIAIIEDITERQRTEDALLQFAAIVESSNDAIAAETLDGVIVSWNPAAERLYGYSATEAHGRPISIVLPARLQDEYEQILERIKRGERIDNFETVRQRKDGRLIDVSVTASPIKDASGRIVGASSIARDITERKQAEAALRKSEAGLARAQRITHLGNWELDLKTGVLNWSDETYRIFGLTPETFGGTSNSFFERVHPDDHNLIHNARDEALVGGAPLNVDHRITLPNGEQKTVNEQAEVVRDPNGNPIMLLGTVLDITARKRAETRIAAFSTLGQGLSSATTAVEAARIIADVADRMIGWDSSSISLFSPNGKLVNSVLCVDIVNGERKDVPLLYNNAPPSAGLERVLNHGAELVLREPQAAFDPHFLPFGDVSRPSASLMYAHVRNGASVIGVLSIQSYSYNAYSRDDLDTLQALADHCGGALERIRAEAENKKLAVFPQFNPDPVLELAPGGDINYFNGAAERLARYLGKKHPSEMLPPETATIVAECLATGRSSLRHQTLIEGRAISWSFFPIKAIGVVHCYASDVTDRQNLEAQLRQSQKMESVGQLAGGIAHDFNNILTVIQGHVTLLSSAGNLSPEAAESSQQIALAADRAANLTRQLLTFSRRQIIQLKNLDLNEVVNNMTKMLRRVLGEDITLQVNYASNLPFIQADPGMLEQILMNLAVNARDAMVQGGRLFANTSGVSIDRAYLDRNPEANLGNFVCLSVRDTGAGIPPELLSRVFEPFFTTKDVGRGTGLGLATVYGIVQQHRGWIKVRSAPGQGAEFQIFFPATAAKPVVEARTPEQPARGGTETVLVVEDETPLRVLVRSVLQRHGYKVLEAGSGREAVDVWREHKEKVQLLLTDMVMPHGMSGRELAARLMAEKPGLKVIYSSGYSLAVVGKDMVLNEGINFLQKPYHPRKLAAAVRDCLDGTAR